MANKPKKIEQKTSIKKLDETKLPKEEDELEEEPERLSSKEEKEEKVFPEEEDYLRQYQYKKVNNVPQVGGKLTDPDKGSKAETMKAALLKQPRVHTLIPLDPGSNPKVPYSVMLNGYRLDFPVNSYIYVPQQVAEKIVQANNQTIAALGQYRVDGDAKKEENLN